MAWDQRPDRRTRRAFLHLSYSYATAVWTGVTRDTRPMAALGTQSTLARRSARWTPRAWGGPFGTFRTQAVCDSRAVAEARTWYASREGLGPGAGPFSPHCMPMHALLPAAAGVDFAGAFARRAAIGFRGTSGRGVLHAKRAGVPRAKHSPADRSTMEVDRHLLRPCTRRLH